MAEIFYIIIISLNPDLAQVFDLISNLLISCNIDIRDCKVQEKFKFHPKKYLQYVSDLFIRTNVINNLINNMYFNFVNGLTEVAGEGGPDLAPQKFLLSQKFRHLMG